MFKYIYFFLAVFLYIFLLPLLIIKSKKDKYRITIPAKFFLKNNPPFEENKIWFHGCSMGEVKALQPIIEKLLNKEEVALSVITNTGYKEGVKFLQNVRYLPFEIFLPFWIKKQKAIFVMEAELWYMLFFIAKHKGAKTYLINARINDKSYKYYKRFKFLYKYIFANVDKVFAQSEVDKKRLHELGAKNIDVIGNIKLVNLPKITKKYEKPSCVLVTAGSTHSNEEELILNNWDKNYGKLVMVPRHPDRFDEVFKLMESKYKNTKVAFHRWSEQKDFNSDIILFDIMGELNNIYAISDVVVLGGSFIKTSGGHNPIEPAYFGCKLISGKTIFNQKSLFDCVDNFYLIEDFELKSYFEKLETLKHTNLGKVGNIKPIIDEITQIQNSK